MNKKPKKRISIGVPLDMLEKIERINQDVYHGHVKVLNVMLCLVDIGILAVDYWGTCARASAVLERLIAEEKPEQEQEEEQEEPVLEKILELMGKPGEAKMVPEFPTGKRLPAEKLIEEQPNGSLGHRWTLEDFQKLAKEKGLEGYRIAAFRSCKYWSSKLERDCCDNEALLYLYDDGVRRFREINYDGKTNELSFDGIYGLRRRHLYHKCPNKLIRWIELFPDANPCAWERQYLKGKEVKQQAKPLLRFWKRKKK